MATVRKRARTGGTTPFALGALPDDALSLVLRHLSSKELVAASATCKNWYLAPDLSVWVGLASKFGVVLPTAGGARRQNTRLSTNLKRAFFAGLARVRKVEALQCDRMAWKIWLALHKADGVTGVKRAVAALPKLASHRISFYEGRTLAMLAAWRGRLGVLQFLVEQCGADPDAEDQLGFTPLMMAAWANRPAVVKYLLQLGWETRQTAPRGEVITTPVPVMASTIQARAGLPRVRLDTEGRPPLSSSCGGKGSKTALAWAHRKGNHECVYYLIHAADGTSPLRTAVAPCQLAPFKLNSVPACCLNLPADVGA